MSEQKKIALVLSGGGARGIAHIGVIEELDRRGYTISSIAGTSMGAVVGGMYALGRLEDFKKWMLSLDKLKVFSLVDFSFSTQGLIKGDRVFDTLREFMDDEQIESLSIPFAAVAVDIRSKQEVVFDKGSLFKALRASVAIPTVVTPVEMGEGLLIDGGVLNNIPVNHVKRSENDRLIAVNVNADIGLEKSPIKKAQLEQAESDYKDKIKAFYEELRSIRGKDEEDDELSYFDLINKTISLMTHRIAQIVLEKHPPDVLIEISKQSAELFDFYRAAELIEVGRAAAIKVLDAAEQEA